MFSTTWIRNCPYNPYTSQNSCYVYSTTTKCQQPFFGMLVAKFRQYLVKKASFSQNTSVYPFTCNYISTNAPCSFFCHSGDGQWTTYAAVPQRQNLISPQECMTAKQRFCCSDTSLPQTRSSAALTLRVTFSEKQLLQQQEN
jgi:hypothetical protein